MKISWLDIYNCLYFAIIVFGIIAFILDQIELYKFEKIYKEIFDQVKKKDDES